MLYTLYEWYTDQMRTVYMDEFETDIDKKKKKKEKRERERKKKSYVLYCLLGVLSFSKIGMIFFRVFLFFYYTSADKYSTMILLLHVSSIYQGCGVRV